MKQNSSSSPENDLEIANRRIRALERELSDRKQLYEEQEEKVQETTQSKVFLTQSAEIAHLGYAVWDDTLDRDVAVSEELAKIHGLTKTQYIKNITSMENYLELVVPDDRKKYQDYEDQFGADESGQTAGVEYRIIRTDGEIRHLHQRSQYVAVSSSKPTQSIVVIQDVTDAKQIEFHLEESREALAQSEALLVQSAVMANLGHATWDCNSAKYLQISEGWARVFGYSKEEFLTKFDNVDRDRELIHPDDLERYQAYYAHADGYGVTPDIECRIVSRKGETRHISQSYEYFLDADGKRTKSLITIQDITDRILREIELKEARKIAEEASLAKSSFLAMMSHEIRTPLNAVLGALGLIDSKNLDPSLTQFLNVGKKGAESLLQIISDILIFSKMEAGKLQLELAIFSVQNAIVDVLQVLGQRASEKNVSLTSNFDKDLPEFLTGDVSRIRQVLLNLCTNAVRFTENGRVNIRVSKLGSENEVTHLRFQVEDTGSGVPFESQEHLFEEFWGTSSTARGSAGGTGLGLLICKQLVEMMGGSIGFESAPGKGSNFWFELALETPGKEALKAEKYKPSSIDQFAGNKEQPQLPGRVLLAEDNIANQLIARTILEQFGLFVDVAANGHQVVTALQTTPYDLVLMDINMPEMDGVEATDRIRNLPGDLSKTPIVAMTALAMPGDRETLLSGGMDAYISKPISREELYTCIATILSGVEPGSAGEQVYSNQSRGTVPHAFDTNALTELTRATGAERQAKIVDTYLAELPDQVAAITSAAASGNCDLVASAAHNMISSSAFLGATGLAELATKIENAGREQNLEKVLTEARHLPKLIEQTREVVARFRTSS